MIFGGVGLAVILHHNFAKTQLIIAKADEIANSNAEFSYLNIHLQNTGFRPLTVLGVSRADCLPVSICEDPPLRLLEKQCKQLHLRIKRTSFGRMDLPILVFVDIPPYKVRLNISIEASVPSGTPTLAPDLNFTKGK
jgi:hypothetical protein